MSSCLFEMVNPNPSLGGSHSVELAHYGVHKWSRGQYLQISARYGPDNEQFYCNQILGSKLRICYGHWLRWYSLSWKRLWVVLNPYSRSSTDWLLTGYKNSTILEGPGVAQWLRHCATSRTVPGSNPGGVGHRDFSRGYRQDHVPWGQLSL